MCVEVHNCCTCLKTTGLNISCISCSWCLMIVTEIGFIKNDVYNRRIVGYELINYFERFSTERRKKIQFYLVRDRMNTV